MSTVELEERLQELRSWQARRLAMTYDDFRRDPHCAAAVEFFLSDLYGPRDLSRREQDLAWILERFRRALPEAACDLLGRALELQALTGELDRAMALQIQGALSEASYAAAYRAVARPEARQRQIDLIVGIGADLERLVANAWIARALRAAHLPAHAAGFGALQDFLERGFAAFRGMGSAQPLLSAIRERETRLMQALLAGADVPPAAPCSPSVPCC